ncbi:glycogen-debranching protein [uncultured Ruminococcus sp.]|uniref:glycogen debranching protein n=1 Tax=uncultured Ruminococcus sp. TaxID=165186 RepID=UPI0025D550C2|nr:alpha-amylase family glycosyl hydrolase [uncultured Ruminococcus sp.]
MKNSSTYKATDIIAGFECRPGIYTLNGASAMLRAVNFTIHSSNATGCSVVLFNRGKREPFAIIPIPDSYRIGDTWSIMIYGLDIYEIEYCYRFTGEYAPSKGHLFDNQTNILDPYARAVTGQSVWGKKNPGDGSYHGRITTDEFDWGTFVMRNIPFSDLVIYELHVRGFTNSLTSGVQHPGTFDGVIEKIPYLKKLGVNAIELMPVFEFDELYEERHHEGNLLMNYWGYNTTCFFAPNTSYASTNEYNHEGDELKKLIRTCNENGILVFLDVVFNHTSEGNEDGTVFSFKGLDNSVYYMLTPDGKYVNFSGCGNTMNCNHPIVQQFIIDCLRYWVIEYRVDGFRFDLASILGRSEDGTPMENPPLLKTIAYDPILSGCKLIAEAWDAGGLYQVGSFPSWNRWAEWNGRFRDDLRCFLKGDNGMAWAAIQRITGSADIYPPERCHNASVNFLTCHDGFTMYDLYSYNVKHNEANGWNNTDGDNSNTSWNCGFEGETENREIIGLRMRMIKNAFATLFFSRGAVMFYAGDEFCNTQFGNNNAYCQDNEVSWLDWSRLKKYREIHDFVRDMIAFRMKHEVIRHSTEQRAFGFPDISLHNTRAWNDKVSDHDHVIGVMFAGKDKKGNDDAVFLGINAYWEECPVELPALPEGYDWNIDFYTFAPYKKGMDFNALIYRCDNTYRLKPRSVIVASAIKKLGLYR